MAPFLWHTVKHQQTNRENEMAKMFTVTDANGTREFTARQHTEAHYAVLPYINAYGFTDAAEHVTVRIQGEAASLREFVQACEDAETARIEKKLQTHDYKRVLYGSSVGCYVWKWIPKK